MTEEIKGTEFNIKGTPAPESENISPDAADAELLEMQLKDDDLEGVVGGMMSPVCSGVYTFEAN